MRAPDLGSIGHLASVATVAASSFEMKLVDPSDLLAAIDLRQWDNLRTINIQLDGAYPKSDVTYVEPSDCGDYGRAAAQRQNQTERRLKTDGGRNTKVLQGKVQRLRDFVVTDAVRFYSLGLGA